MGESLLSHGSWGVFVKISLLFFRKHFLDSPAMFRLEQVSIRMKDSLGICNPTHQRSFKCCSFSIGSKGFLRENALKMNEYNRVLKSTK